MGSKKKISSLTTQFGCGDVNGDSIEILISCSQKLELLILKVVAM